MKNDVSAVPERPDFEVLITAKEAYPEFERAVLDAERRVDMGFRVFNPLTKLVSDEAKAIGETWVDLLGHKLQQGVEISISLSDFDPIVRAKLHRASWKSYSILIGLAEAVGHPERLRVQVAAHPARVGWGPRLVLWPKVMSQITEACAWVDELPIPQRTDALRCMPRLRRLVDDVDGKLLPIKQQMPPMMPATHHQKLAVIDDEVLYIGGLDLDQRRMDTPDHHGAASQLWHDVQLLVRAPDLARSARTHLDRFQQECAGNLDLEPPKGLIRTLSTKRKLQGAFLSPEISETSILDAHLKDIETSENLIYLESQFFRDPILADALAKRAQDAPELGLILVLPAAPQEVAFEDDDGPEHKYGEHLQAQCVAQIEEAFGERLFIGSPAQLRRAETTGRSVLCDAPMIFIHSKVSIFDQASALVTSANLNGRSMRWDTEIGLRIIEADRINLVRQRVMGAWLPDNAANEMFEPAVATVQRWRELAQENAATHPESRRGFILPYDAEPGRSFGASLPGVPAEMV